MLCVRALAVFSGVNQRLGVGCVGRRVAFYWSLFTLVLGRACFGLSSCFLSPFCRSVELSFGSVSQARHLLGAILRCLFVFCYLLVGAGFDSPAKLACWCTPV